MSEKKFKDLSEREIKVKHLQVDIHDGMIRDKENEVEKLNKEIEQDIPNSKVRLEIRKCMSDIELYKEVISRWKKEIRDKKEEIVERK